MARAEEIHMRGGAAGRSVNEIRGTHRKRGDTHEESREGGGVKGVDTNMKGNACKEQGGREDEPQDSKRRRGRVTGVNEPTTKRMRRVQQKKRNEGQRRNACMKNKINEMKKNEERKDIKEKKRKRMKEAQLERMRSGQAHETGGNCKRRRASDGQF